MVAEPSKLGSRAPGAIDRVVEFIAAALSLVLFAELGRWTGAREFGFIGFWPPAGMTIGALVLLPPSRWPTLLAGFFAANYLWTKTAWGASPLPAFGMAAANSLEAVVAATLVRTALERPPSFERVHDVVVFASSVFVAAVLGALVGVGSLAVAGGLSDFPAAWQAWWLADLAGGLVFGPLVAMLLEPGGGFWRSIAAGRPREVVVLAGAFLLFTVWIFGREVPYPLAPPSFIVPLFLWAALRLGPRATALFVAAYSAVAVKSTIAGLGPFADPRVALHEQLVSIQAVLGATAVSMQLLAAAVLELIRSRDQLAESRRRLADAENRSAVVAATLDFEGRWLSFPASLARFLKSTSENLRDHGLCDFVEGIFRTQLLETLADLREGRVRSAELETLLRSNGAAGRWTRISLSSVDGADGRPASVLAYFRDEDDQKRAELALKESEGRFRTFAENLRDVVWFTERLDQDHYRILYINPAFERIWGKPTASILANEEEWLLSIVPEDRERIARAYKDNYLKGGFDETYRIERPDGTMRWIRDRGFVVPTPPGSLPRMAGVAEDVTDELQSAEERRELDRRLQEMQKLESLGVLAGGIAHDFNNLLTTILGNANLARMEVAPQSPVHPFLEQIEKTSLRAAELCRQMLAYSGKGKFVVQRVDLNALLREVTHLLEVSISKKAVLRFRLTEPLPPVIADATQMRQVVMNLVINASEAIGERSGVISLATGLIHTDKAYLEETCLPNELEEGEYVYLEVADTGVGMDELTKARVFEPFFSTKFTGRGLGLAAVHGIVRGHRGTIKVYSEAGRGSTFKVLLPAAEGVVEPTPEPMERAPFRSQGKVLVVDDEDSVRAVAVRMLEQLGFVAVQSRNGVDAIEVVRADPDIRLVILDLTMPILDGEESYREIRKLRPGLPTIVMSGFSEQEAVLRFLGKGISGFLQKPFRKDQLADRVRAALEVPPAEVDGFL